MKHHPVSDSTAFLTGLYLLLIPLGCLLGASASLLAGGDVSPLIFPLAVVMASIAVGTIGRQSRHKCIVSLIRGVAITTGCVICSTLLDDASSDGIIYHQEIIVHLLNGWNPVRSGIAGSPDPDLELLAAHYANGAETMAATIAAFTGRIESGKAVNMLIIIGTGMIVWSVLWSRLNIGSRRRATVITLLTVSCPVGMSQALTYYNDFYCYYLILLTISAFLLTPGRLTRAGISAIGGIVIVAAAVKFTAFFYVGVTIAAVMLYYLWEGKSGLCLRIGLTALAWAAVAVCITSYHPYITNLIRAGHPCYPLMGEGAIDIMSYNTPEVCLSHNRFINFIISLFTLARPGVAPPLGGFGPLASVMIILSLAIVAVGRRHVGSVWGYAAVMILASCFVFEQTWWARYIPFLWLIPVIGAIVATRLTSGWRKIGAAVAWSGIGWGAICLAASLFMAVQLTTARQIALSLVTDNLARVDTAILCDDDGGIISRGILSTERHIREAGLNIMAADADKHSNDITISLTGNNLYPTSVRLHLDREMEPKVITQFSQTLTARLLRLHIFISRDRIAVLPSQDE